MDASFPGLGTLLNTAAVVAGSLVGMGAGHRLPERVRAVTTDCLGLVTLLVGALSAASVTDATLTAAVGSPVLVVLGSLLLGGMAGAALRIEERLGGLAGALQARLAGRRSPSRRRGRRTGPPGRPEPPAGNADARERFIEGWLTATLLFCVGPLTILGSLNDGLGRGIDQLAVKSVLDGFAAIAFAASFGVGVLLSAFSVLVIQGSLTLAGVMLGSLMPAAQIAALTATGGLMLIGIGIRLLRIRDVPVGDLLPALVVAPFLAQAVTLLR